MGRQLAKESAVNADLVTPVPDSGVPAAIGYAEESKIPLEFGLIRNHYVGRTFIEPQQTIRHFGVKIKLNAQREVLNGKRVIVVDDSIVRDKPEDHSHAARCRRKRSSHAHQFTGYHRSMLLRHRHTDPY
jgi:glutamine phosphoribosylpyrophosphate amidotransferase